MKRPPSERRRTPRIKPFVARCRLRVGSRSHAGYVTDISTGGAQVSWGGEAPAVGSLVVLEVRLDPRFRPSRLPSRVLWTRSTDDGGLTVGLSFAELAEAEQRTLEEVVEEYRRKAAELAKR
jgi:hypothetical protein